MEEYLEHVKKIKKMLGDFMGEIAEEKKISGANVAVVKETLSAFQKACWICEDLEEESGGNYGDGRGGNSSGSGNNGGVYGAQRRSRRTGRYMMSGGYGWMPGPYYDGGPDRYGLADDLENVANNSNSEAEKTIYREAAYKLRNGNG